jgi:molybdopterin-guanine dinucleotide biosynthesis protein B
MLPIISIVGRSKSGKTTLIEKLLAEMGRRGYQVATIKHAPQGLTLGEQDKDSWRHLQAGSQAAAVSSPDMVLLVKPARRDIPLDEVAALLGEDYDLILTEGFKGDDAPKIEVHRREAGPPLKGLKRLVAVVTDEPLEAQTRRFSVQDIGGLADFIEDGFIRPQQERVSLQVNGAPVPMNTFTRGIIASALLAMVSSLKGVGKISRLQISVRKGPR